MRTLLNFRRRAEGSIACESTGWKLRSRASEKAASDGPRMIPQRLWSTASVQSQVNKGNPTGRSFCLPAHGLGPAREESGVMNHYSSAPFTNDLQRVFLLTLVPPMAVRVPPGAARGQQQPGSNTAIDRRTLNCKRLMTESLRYVCLTKPSERPLHAGMEPPASRNQSQGRFRACPGNHLSGIIREELPSRKLGSPDAYVLRE